MYRHFCVFAVIPKKQFQGTMIKNLTLQAGGKVDNRNVIVLHQEQHILKHSKWTITSYIHCTSGTKT